MTSALIGMAGVVLGALVTTLVELVRSRTGFAREKSWELYEERRRRIERIYEAVEDHRAAYRDLFTKALATVEDLEAHQGPFTPVPWPRLRILVHLYEPDMLPELAVLERTGNELGKQAAIALAASAAPQKAEVRTDLAAAFATLERAYDDFIVKLVTIATDLASAAAASVRPPPTLGQLWRSWFRQRKGGSPRQGDVGAA